MTVFILPHMNEIICKVFISFLRSVFVWRCHVTGLGCCPGSNFTSRWTKVSVEQQQHNFLCWHFIFFPDEIVLILRKLKEMLSPFPRQIHQMKMTYISLEKQKDMTTLQKYWLFAILLCQMFSLKRIKGESWACGRSLLHSMLVR